MPIRYGSQYSVVDVLELSVVYQDLVFKGREKSHIKKFRSAIMQRNNGCVRELLSAENSKILRGFQKEVTTL